MRKKQSGFAIELHLSNIKKKEKSVPLHAKEEEKRKREKKKTFIRTP